MDLRSLDEVRSYEEVACCQVVQFVFGSGLRQLPCVVHGLAGLLQPGALKAACCGLCLAARTSVDRKNVRAPLPKAGPLVCCVCEHWLHLRQLHCRLCLTCVCCHCVQLQARCVHVACNDVNR